MLTTIAEVTNQIQTVWAPLWTKQLRESTLLAQFVNKEYEGAIRSMGNKVRVSQVNDPTGELRTAGVDSDSFGTDAISTSYVEVTANKRAVVAYEFEDLVELQSQITRDNVQAGMLQALKKKINDYLYSLVSPSTSSPDHVLAPSSIGLTELANYRRLAAESKWDYTKPWIALFSPEYWETINTNTTLASGDYTEGMPVVNGQRSRKLMGFECYEDNSRTGKTGLIFHPDFLLHVEQTQIQVKISDLHSNKQFGTVLSLDLVFGSALGLDGDLKHISECLINRPYRVCVYLTFAQTRPGLGLANRQVIQIKIY